MEPATRWRAHVILWMLVARCSADSNNDYPGQLDLGAQFELENYGNSSLVRRRLFSLSLPVLSDVQNVVGEATKWVTDSTLKLAEEAGVALGLGKLLQFLKDGNKFVERGKEFAHDAFEGMQQLVNELMQIYVQFKPLLPIFADKNGLMALLTSASNLRILVKTVENLLKTSNALHYLGDVLQKASRMLSEIMRFFHQLLDSHVNYRRLQRYSINVAENGRKLGEHQALLLDGLSVNFTSIVQAIAGFIPTVSELADTFESLNMTFAPLLEKLDSLLSVSSRRLNAIEDQHIYEEAIKKIVPSWKAVESLSIDVCPVVLDAKTSALSLACRVKGFIDGSGELETVTPLVEQCEDPPVASSSAICPTVSLSSGIKDLLSKNSNSIALILTIVGSCLGVGVVGGVGGAIAIKKGRKRASFADYDEDEDQLEELAPGDDTLS